MIDFFDTVQIKTNRIFSYYYLEIILFDWNNHHNQYQISDIKS